MVISGPGLDTAPVNGIPEIVFQSPDQQIVVRIGRIEIHPKILGSTGRRPVGGIYRSSIFPDSS
jgi:hypothetical protein